ncbi:MAG: DNA polymerase III subunit [Pirellulaceae bacterium]|nr:DNA polymerase III subunit [Pirellulaceae bacterium]
MIWNELLGHQGNVDFFRRGLANNRLASTYLFVGPSGVGKGLFARLLTQALICEEVEGLNACGQCSSCQQVHSESHPDVQVIRKPAEKSFLPVEKFIGDREHRMREGLCHFISLKPSGRYKVGIIEDADYLNAEGANSLLKTLEEPPAQALLILLSSSEQKQLPTIRSRCQIVRFGELRKSEIEQLLLKYKKADPQTVARIACYGNGSMARAEQLLDEEVLEFYEEFWKLLEKVGGNRDSTIKLVGHFCEQAGKESSRRRERMIMVCDFAAEHFRMRLTRLVERGHSSRELLEEYQDRLLACIERTFEVIDQVHANINQSTLLECWIDELILLLSGLPLPPSLVLPTIE